LTLLKILTSLEECINTCLYDNIIYEQNVCNFQYRKNIMILN